MGSTTSSLTTHDNKSVVNNASSSTTGPMMFYGVDEKKSIDNVDDAEKWGEDLNVPLEISSDPKKLCKYLQVTSKLKYAIQKRETAISNRDASDAIEHNVIGNYYDAISNKYEVIIRHCKTIIEAYQNNGESEEMADNLLKKVAILEKLIKDCTDRVDELLIAQEKWKRDVIGAGKKKLILEKEVVANGALEITIEQSRFDSELIRVEKSIKTGKEQKMAAECLMIKLKSQSNKLELEEEMKELFPNNNLTVDDVFPYILLYCINFKAVPNESTTIQLFTDVQSKALESRFVTECYPSMLMDMSCWVHDDNV